MRKIEEYLIFEKTIGVAYSIAPTKSAYFAPRLPSPLREGEEVRVDFIAARVRSSSFRLRRHFRRITRGTMRSGNRQEEMWTRTRSSAAEGGNNIAELRSEIHV